MPVIDTDTGKISLFADAEPLWPGMCAREFEELYSAYNVSSVRAEAWTPNSEEQGRRSSASVAPYVSLGVPFRVSFNFLNDMLNGLVLSKTQAQPPPTSLIGRLCYNWRLFFGGPVPPMSEEEERQWCREMKDAHDDWIERALGTTHPLREWPSWGRIESVDAHGPMYPFISIQLFHDAM